MLVGLASLVHVLDLRMTTTCVSTVLVFCGGIFLAVALRMERVSHAACSLGGSYDVADEDSHGRKSSVRRSCSGRCSVPCLRRIFLDAYNHRLYICCRGRPAQHHLWSAGDHPTHAADRQPALVWRPVAFLHVATRVPSRRVRRC